ncbi:hypothetical protein [Nocardia farcinica]|nr:hypothetical protein [Nocardia farcinica]
MCAQTCRRCRRACAALLN